VCEQRAVASSTFDELGFSRRPGGTILVGNASKVVQERPRHKIFLLFLTFIKPLLCERLQRVPLRQPLKVQVAWVWRKSRLLDPLIDKKLRSFVD